LSHPEAQGRNGPPRHRRILEAVKHAFSVGAKQHVWRDELAWLFGLRDAAVHHGARPRTPVASARFKNLVAPETLAFSREGAERAWALLLDVVRTCLASPKRESEAFASEHRSYVDQLLESLERKQEARHREALKEIVDTPRP
jgi:hypothetical protein